jgi:hypothetical protein
MSTNNYNYVIIGSGPSALSFAHAVNRAGKTVLIIEKENTPGGCHRVMRTPEGYFTEHGPRIYSDVYKAFSLLIRDMTNNNVRFEDLFYPQQVDFQHIGNFDLMKGFGWKESWKILQGLMRLTIDSTYGYDITMQEFTKDFSPELVHHLDLLCRFSDGATLERFSVNEFLQMFNQQALYQIYEPYYPNDQVLFPLWMSFLQQHGTTFRFGVKVVSMSRRKINQDQQQHQQQHGSGIDQEIVSSISSTSVGTTTSSAHDNYFVELKLNDGTTLDIQQNNTRLIFANPPISLMHILEKSSYDPFGPSFHEFAKETKYITYISCSLEWKNNANIKNNTETKKLLVQNFPPNNEWGIAILELFQQQPSQKKHYHNNTTTTQIIREQQHSTTTSTTTTIISTAITVLDKKSHHLHKTAHECTAEELKEEILHVLQLMIPNLPPPTSIALSPNLYHENGEWHDRDSGFIGRKFIPFESNEDDHIYSLGPQNGESQYGFTSLEAAVNNALTLANKLHPGKIPFTPQKFFTLVDYIHFTLLFIVLMLIVGKKGMFLVNTMLEMKSIFFSR